MDGEQRASAARRAGGLVTRPAALAGAIWADFALVTVELGLVDSWTPSGGEWDGARWDEALWGESYLTPHEWVDITADVQSLDLDTGRNGVDDPGEIGTASVTLYDPLGAYAIAGTSKSAIGNLLRVSVAAIAAGRSGRAFHGKVTEAGAVGDLVAPATSIKAIDLLGAVVSTDDPDPLPAQSVTERLVELLDRAGVPAELRDLADDGTALLALEKTDNRLDAARDAVASSIGGTLWATGDGTIRYRFGTFLVPPGTLAEYAVGTVGGAVCPSSLNLAEKGSDVVNVYDWTTSDKDNPLHAAGSDTESIRRFGRSASVRTDLLNAQVDELRALVEAELARTAWSPERVDTCSIPIHDDASAALVTVQLGELVDFAYSGSAPWSSRQLVGSYAHHVTPGEWTVDLKAFPAITTTQWGEAAWDVDAWSLGAILPAA
jgi:hypothetical protein